jgi:hypothetical protein
VNGSDIGEITWKFRRQGTRAILAQMEVAMLSVLITSWKSEKQTLIGNPQ